MDREKSEQSDRDSETDRHLHLSLPAVPCESLLVVRVARVIVTPEARREIKDRCKLSLFQGKKRERARENTLTHTGMNVNEMCAHLKSFPPSSSSKSELEKEKQRGVNHVLFILIPTTTTRNIFT